MTEVVEPTAAEPQTVEPPTEGPEPGEKLVPVAESIRYRRRAQAAEQKLEAIEAELGEARDELERAHRQVEQADRRRQIDELLIEADVIDLEAARLLTEHTIGQMDDAELGEVVSDLARHKPYLFRRRGSGGGMSPRPRGNGGAGLDEAAAAAAATGDRRDLLRYLRLRRRSH
jgi:multidrug efflux pump subunit AcrA (membrane-fusion protein)